MLKPKLQRDFLIVGAGPVGLTAALFLKKMGLSFALLEKKTGFSTHPSAHYLNMRTMEVLSELNGVSEAIYRRTENREFSRYYRYCRRIFDPRGAFAVHDHFGPTIDQKIKELSVFSFREPVHLPQFSLLDVLREKIDEREVLLGTEVVDLKIGRENVAVETLEGNKEKGRYEGRYLIAADGFHSIIRERLGIKMTGFSNLQSFMNIFFKSRKLSQKIHETREFAMLHFIYNSDICAVLVNHSIEKGLFVLQIPIFPPFHNFEKLKEKAGFLINACLDSASGLKPEDFEIINVGLWNLSGCVAEKYYQDRCFLVGDAAHSFPPAGGFGLNTGIQDIHNLIHKLHSYPFPSNQEMASKSLEFSAERREIGLKNLNTAMKYYEKSLEIPKILGLDIQNLRFFKGFLENLPLVPNGVKAAVFSWGVKIGGFSVEKREFSREKELLKEEKNKIPLIFIEEDVRFKYGEKRRLLPLFRIVLRGETRIETTSREFIMKVDDLVAQGALKPASEGEKAGFEVVFFRQASDLKEGFKKDNVILLRIVEAGETKPERMDFQCNEVEIKEDKDGLFGQASVVSVRPDGHLI